MTIINMPYSDKGRDEHDRVFRRIAQEQKVPVKVLPGGMKYTIINLGSYVYVAYLNDRHTEPEIKLFVDRESAIECAREFMFNNMANTEGITVIDIEGYDIYLAYEYESDSAFVVRTKIE